MEPVTWFTGVVEMTIGAYMYYLYTCKEYSSTHMAHNLTEWRFKYLCKIHDFDMKRYEVLMERIKEIEAELHTGEKLQVGEGGGGFGIKKRKLRVVWGYWVGIN